MLHRVTNTSSSATCKRSGLFEHYTSFHLRGVDQPKVQLIATRLYQFLSKQASAIEREGAILRGGGGRSWVLLGPYGGVCGSALFQTKICNFPVLFFQAFVSKIHNSLRASSLGDGERELTRRLKFIPIFGPGFQNPYHTHSVKSPPPPGSNPTSRFTSLYEGIAVQATKSL